jgi:hypothetical protein
MARSGPASKPSFEENFETDDSAEMQFEQGEGLVIDLSSTDENIKYPVHPKGVYDAEMTEMDYTRSQSSNSPMWVTIWELTDEKLADERGRQPRVWLHLTFNEGGLPRVKRALARMETEDGYNKELLSGPFDPQKVADEGRLIGARARLRIDIRRYEGQNRNNVREVLAPAASGGGSAFGRL